MQKIKMILVLFVGVTGFTLACSKDGNNQGSTIAPVNCDQINAKFEADISPIILSSCANGGGCHGTGSTNGPGALTNFNQVQGAAGSIKSAVASGRMPLSGSLSQEEIRKISCWVDSGAPNN